MSENVSQFLGIPVDFEFSSVIEFCVLCRVARFGFLRGLTDLNKGIIKEYFKIRIKKQVKENLEVW